MLLRDRVRVRVRPHERIGALLVDLVADVRRQRVHLGHDLGVMRTLPQRVRLHAGL